ncbi:MAG: Response regulator receiver domain [Nitrospira sp.]|jgi:DNA-binding NtrC family response regulator|nr:Response regulator receiver domain [Nitrospira sp.]
MTTSVLVIDNDCQVREFLCAALELDGHAAVGAKTYAEAIAQLRWSMVDLAISDGFTGVGLAGVSTIHRLFPTLRMLVMSGGVSDHACVPLQDRTLSILPKPCPVRTILETVRCTLMEIPENPMRDIIERGRFDFITSILLSSECHSQPRGFM